MAKKSSYQQRVIRNYYENQGTILLSALGDLVTDLYLAEGQARARLWKRERRPGKAQAASQPHPARRGQR